MDREIADVAGKFENCAIKRMLLAIMVTECSCVIVRPNGLLGPFRVECISLHGWGAAWLVAEIPMTWMSV